MSVLTRLVFVVMVLLALVSVPVVAVAQADEGATSSNFSKRRLMVQPRNADGTVAVVPFREDPVMWLRGTQKNFYTSMSNALKSMREAGAAKAAWTLMLLSFIYGVLHAAGPGHGKAVISAWVLATGSQLRRGIMIAFMSSIIQALTAIALVSGFVLVVGRVGFALKDSVAVLESASYALIAAAGLYVMWGGIKALKLFGAKPAAARAVAAASNSSSAGPFEIVNPLPPHPDPSHVHGPDCGCGHAHVPSPEDVEGAWSLPKALSLAFAVGIRPCSGAVLVLSFAYTIGFYWAGVLSTFVMSLGTFITVAAIAALAVTSKQLAERLFVSTPKGLDIIGHVLRLGGGLVVTVLGLFLLVASWGGAGGSF